MLEDDGHWMKLMRTATLPTDANICLRISGRDIVCTVTKDVNKEVELKVTCRIADPCHEHTSNSPPLPDHEEGSPQAPQVTEVKLEDSESVPEDCISSKAMLDCASNSACSFSDTAVGSSSVNSREVSEERSFKSENGDSDIDMEDFQKNRRVSPSSESTTCAAARTKVKDERQNSALENNQQESREDGLSRSPHSQAEEHSSYYERHKRVHSESSRTNSNPPNPKAFCEPCKIQFMSVNTYQVHKKFYCKSRHDKEDSMAQIPAVESSTGGLPNAFKPPSDTVILRSGLNGSVHPSVIQPQAIYAAISTNPLILVPCTLVPGQGLVPQNSILPGGAPGLVISNGIPPGPSTVERSTTVEKFESTSPIRKISHPAMSTGDEHNDSTLLSSTKIASLKRKISEGEVLNLKKTCLTNDSTAIKAVPEKTKEEEIVEQDSPLDLTLKVKKESDSIARNSPTGRRSSVISIGHPSSPVHPVYGSGSPPGLSAIPAVHNVPSPTHSYSNDSFPSQVPVVVHRVPTAVSDRISPLPPVLQSAIIDKPIPAPGLLPPKLLKQGNNVCDECHIVFFKYDNLVTHKKHYCAYRRRQLSAMAAAAAATSSREQSSDDNNSNHSDTIEGVPGYATDDSKSGIRKLEYSMEHCRQPVTKATQPAYLCDACGVRFSTSDTLIAHQTYYCMKKPDSAMAKASNKKGDDGNYSNLESPFSGPEEWKCNYCDATCASYDTIRRHLLTHSEPRGYRCLICGYKGNTLRGMRTHACEHLNDDTTSVEDFMTSTIMVLSDNAMVPRNFDGSDDDSDVQREAAAFRHRERTCNNSDSVKERTVKLERSATDASEGEHQPDSPKGSNSAHNNTNCFKRTGSFKTESSEGSPDANGNPESVNPLTICDVVIKTENASGDDSDHGEAKLEREPEDHVADKPKTCHPRSVIRVAEKHVDISHPVKRKAKSQTKPDPNVKSCTTCGVTFQHVSTLLTHRKYYCGCRSLQNCLPEPATVQ